MDTPLAPGSVEVAEPATKPDKGGPVASAPLLTIWRRRWIVLLCAVLGMIISYGYAKLCTPIYTASTQVIATSDRPRGIETNQSNPPTVNLYTELSIITSSTVLSDAAALLDDPQWYWDNGYDVLVDGQRVHNSDVMLQARPLPPEDRRPVPAGADVIPLHTFDGRSRIYTLHRNLQPVIGKEDQIITLGFDSPYPSEAAIIANAITSAYLNFSSGERHTSAAEMVRMLESKHEEFQREIDAKDQAIAGLIKANPMLYLDTEKTNPIQERLVALNAELTAANIAMLNAKEVYEQAAKQDITDVYKLQSLIQTGQYDGHTVKAGIDGREILAEVNAANAQLEAYQRVYRDNHPTIVYLKEQIDLLNASYVLFLEHQYELAKQTVAAYQDAFNDANRSAQELSARRADYSALVADRQNTQQMLEVLDTRMKEIHVDDDPSSVNLQVLEPAAVPVVPSRPQKIVVMFEGLLLGLICGVVLSLLDPRILVEDEAATLGLPVLGLVPPMNRREHSSTHATKVLLDPISNVAEAFRGIRGALIRAPKVKTILVTSATRGEGKSTVASNLAAALAGTGRRVLLIDADLRDPSQHYNYDDKDSVGLSGRLADGVTPELAVVSTSTNGLFFLPAGDPPHNPGELLDTEEFCNLLLSFSQQYEFVVVDAPPVLPVADARILGSMCDASILVVRAGSTKRQGVRDARDGLLGFGANVLGIVVNHCVRKRNEYSYYGGPRRRLPEARQPAEGLLFAEDESPDETLERVPHVPESQAL